MSALKQIEQVGGRAWLTGDTVRQIVMGKHPSVLSVALESGKLEDVAEVLGGSVDRQSAYPVLRIKVQDLPVDIVPLQGGSIEADLERRDFSMNAVALRSDGGIVDPFGGRHDIRNRLVRLTGDNIELVKQDPLRIVRMLRFAAELDMRIFWKSETDVRKFVRTHPDSIRNIPLERWGREIASGIRWCPYTFLQLCDTYHLIPFFLPELTALKENDVPCSSTKKTFFEQVMGLLRVAQERIAHHRLKASRALAFAGVFCCIGTPADKDSAICFPKPDTAKAAEYLRCWNIPNHVVESVVAVLDHYLSLLEHQTEEQLSDSVLRCGLVTMETALELASCAAESAGIRDVDDIRANRYHLEQIRRRFASVARQTDGGQRFLSGDDLISLLNIAPGPQVGMLLEQLDKAVALGTVATRAEAETWVRGRANV